MHTEIIKPNEKKNYNLITTIILLVLGLVLITNSNTFVTIAFEIVGAFIILFGLYRTFRYMSLKKQFKVEDNDALISGIISITVGLLIILLAGVLEVGLRYIIGFYLLFSGINKISLGLRIKDIQKKLSITYFIEGGILGIIGLYTILFANAALIIVGILMVLSSIFDLISYFKNKI